MRAVVRAECEPPTLSSPCTPKVASIVASMPGLTRSSTTSMVISVSGSIPLGAPNVDDDVRAHDAGDCGSYFFRKKLPIRGDVPQGVLASHGICEMQG